MDYVIIFTLLTSENIYTIVYIQKSGTKNIDNRTNYVMGVASNIEVNFCQMCVLYKKYNW